MEPGNLVVTTQSILFKPDPWDWAQVCIPAGEVLPVVAVYDDRVAVEYDGHRVGIQEHLFNPLGV
jgi:hypothetical protein